MAYEKICTLDDVWEGEMGAFTAADGTRVLVIFPTDGTLVAVQAVCPHQEIELIRGKLEDNVLTCSAHLWQFDAQSGKGINPAVCELAVYPTKIDGDDVYVDVAGITPRMARA